jgi:hypothetical protein
MECTCSETPARRLCPACDAAYVKWNIEEVYGQRCTPAEELSPLEALGLSLAQGRKAA